MPFSWERLAWEVILYLVDLDIVGIGGANCILLLAFIGLFFFFKVSCRSAYCLLPIELLLFSFSLGRFGWEGSLYLVNLDIVSHQ